MKTLIMIIFFTLFISIVLYLSYTIAKLEVEKEKKESDRQALEAENSEFEYGHNIKNYMEE